MSQNAATICSLLVWNATTESTSDWHSFEVNVKDLFGFSHCLCVFKSIQKVFHRKFAAGREKNATAFYSQKREPNGKSVGCKKQVNANKNGVQERICRSNGMGETSKTLNADASDIHNIRIKHITLHMWYNTGLCVCFSFFLFVVSIKLFSGAILRALVLKEVHMWRYQRTNALCVLCDHNIYC